MKNRILATICFLSLTGCMQKVTQVPGLDRVMTASEFTAQPELRDRVLKFCADDPGRYKTDPNCLNSQQSARVTTSGTGNFPSLDTSPPASMTGKK